MKQPRFVSFGQKLGFRISRCHEDCCVTSTEMQRSRNQLSFDSTLGHELCTALSAACQRVIKVRGLHCRPALEKQPHSFTAGTCW